MQVQLNPFQMQIYQHFNQKLEEQKKIMQQCDLDFNKVRGELPQLVQKIQESDITKGVR